MLPGGHVIAAIAALFGLDHLGGVVAMSSDASTESRSMHWSGRPEELVLDMGSSCVFDVSVLPKRDQV